MSTSSVVVKEARVCLVGHPNFALEVVGCEWLLMESGKGLADGVGGQKILIYVL